MQPEGPFAAAGAQVVTRYKCTRRLVSWDGEYARLNALVIALALVAVAGHFLPPWFGVGS